MSNIQLLDNETINKIAAGEVVERPVNVCKELLENAIDSNATVISVEIKNGGIDMIRVTDNGSGIQKNQVKNAFLRHATSKLSKIEDLESILTLGFRGEALSSISAVSKTELITKVSDELLGIRCEVDGGKLMEFSEIGAPNGTTVIVRNLFYNTPVRKKFLKTPQSEGAKIEEVMEKLVLSHPDISFSLINNGKTKFQTNGNGSLKDAVYTIFGSDIYKRLLDVDYEENGVSINGVLLRPEINMSTRDSEIVFVNERLVSSKELSLAIEEGYKGYLMQHQFPFAVIFIKIDPSLVDVNIHPRKSEIRFNEPAKILEIITSAINNTLKEPELIPQISLDNIKSEVYTKDIDVISFSSEEVKEKETISSSEKELSLGKDNKPSFEHFEPFELNRIKDKKEETLTTKEDLPKYEQTNLFEDKENALTLEKNYRIIGQVFDTYWLISFEDNLYIVDQHAAHEKVNYEHFLSIYKESAKGLTQYLNPPTVFHLTASEEDVLLSNMPLFNKLGFEIENFGERSYAMRGVPIELFEQSEQDLFKRLLSQLVEREHIKDPEVVLEKLASMSCKAAVKGNMHISEAEMKELMKRLMSLENPYNCPHGRPVFISISKTELEKKFKRIV